MLEFPKGFFWGAATSAYQVEGNNINADWWEWEKRVGLKEASGEACRHYGLYKSDFDLARLLNQNAHRLSIEWSRVEPREGEFSAQEIGHYKDVILSLRQRNLEPIVTLHHFTNPSWFAELGGWQNKRACRYFLRYVEKIVGVLSEDIKYWVTINEPMVYVYHSYILGIWPPQEKSFLKARRVRDNLAFAHIQSCRIIRSIYKQKRIPPALISIAQSMQAFFPCTQSLKNKLAVYLRDRLFNLSFIEKLIRSNALDFIGINYYSRTLVDVEGWGMRHLFLDVCKSGHHPLSKNSLGWDIYPEGLYNLLMRIKRYDLPVFILENGICTEDDNTRWNFICEHLRRIHRAIASGVKILGYIYWSLIDNFEWDSGFGPRFGLIGVDYNTYERAIRESAEKYSLVAKTGRLE